MNTISKRYIDAIKRLQNTLVSFSVLGMVTFPFVLAYFPSYLPTAVITTLFSISLAAVTWVMSIRPLADLFPELPWLRPLVVLRKGAGILSASIIVSFMISKLMTAGIGYFAEFSRAGYWSTIHWAGLAHVGDVTAIILLLTSNNLSKRLLGSNWKRIQKLAYIYFYAGAGYEMLAFDSTFAFVAIIIVTLLVGLAHIKNSARISAQTI